MPARVSAPARERDYDYSNVGKVGRRTGVTLPPRPLNEHGLEEMSGLFSSPRKPSPASNKIVVESIEVTRVGSSPLAGVQTPRPPKSVPRAIRGHSNPPPRSASPKKSGITGTARRSGAIDVLSGKQLQPRLLEETAAQEDDTRISTTPSQNPSNTRAASARPATTKRFSPDRTPLRNRALHQRMAKSTATTRLSDLYSPAQETLLQEDLPEETPSRIHAESPHREATLHEMDASGVVNLMGEDDESEAELLTRSPQLHANHDIEPELEPELLEQPIIDNDYSDEDQTFAPGSRSTNTRNGPNKANSRRKRKSDAFEEGDSVGVAVPPQSNKRAKQKTNGSPSSMPKQDLSRKNVSTQDEPQAASKSKSSDSTRGRKALAKKNANFKMSSQREKELENVVEKIKARPFAPKSLYVLRRETPADDSVTHTRSGRVSIKPLAYWRNERCIYSGTPGRVSAGIADGDRFPMNSIKEVVRTEELDRTARTKSRRTKRSKGKKGKAKANTDVESDSDLELDSGSEQVDPDADEWEIDSGTLKGPVASWDVEHQVGLPEDPTEIEVAYAHAAIRTKDVKGSTFRYAKLLSTRFLGAGVVDLPGGGVKRAKNSRKMHMCFFVVQGRVTVQVGALNPQDADNDAWGTRFSIGKGGFWQVPRGNQYSIENEHGKTARIFFSQGCEAVPEDD